MSAKHLAASCWVAVAVLGIDAVAAPSGDRKAPPTSDPQSKPGAPARAPQPNTEAEFLVPPGGGAFDVPIHPGAICILSFPEPVTREVMTSASTAFEIKAWDKDGVAVRATQETRPGTFSTVALASTSGSIKVNVTVRVVEMSEPALTVVRFRPVSYEEAIDAAVAVGVAKQLAPLRAELEAKSKELDERIQARADAMMIDRALRRSSQVSVVSHARNDDHVIVHLRRGQMLGLDGYLMFEVENRSGAPYRVASVRVLREDREIQGTARIVSPTVERDPAILATVAAGTRARGLVIVRGVDRVLGKPLVFEVSGPGGRGKIRLDRGVVLR